MKGDLLAVGSRFSSGSGPVVIYRREGTRWVLDARLSFGGSEHESGSSHSLALSGERLAIGVDRGGLCHEVEVHVRETHGWTLEAVLCPEGPISLEHRATGARRRVDPSSPPDCFASVLALEGETLVAAGSGARVRIFERRDDGWELVAAFDPFHAELVASAIALQGDRLAVGAPAGERGPDEHSGAVLAFRREEGAWRDQLDYYEKASVSDGWFGSSLAWTARGLAVGTLPTATRPDAGTVTFFDDVGGEWTVTEVLRAGPRSSGFGASLAADGKWLAVGAPYGDTVVIHSAGEDGWTECGRWAEAGTPGAGWSLALSADRLTMGWLCGVCVCLAAHCTCDPAQSGPARHPTPVLALR